MTAPGGLVDNHAHSLLRNFLQLDVHQFRACWSESSSEEMIAKHVQHQLHYQNMLEDLGELLGVQGEAAIVEKRSRLDPREYVRTLLSEAGVASIVVDDGFGSERMLALRELRALVGDEIEIKQCRRIEVVLERCLSSESTFSGVCDKFEQSLLSTDADGNTPVALKTIMAYRGGLQLDAVTSEAAERDFAQLSGFAPGTRIARRPLYHYFLMRAFELAAASAMPVQIHTGFGDDDADLIQSNPALLQPLFRTPSLGSAVWILLHCYPYVREAAFMCALYPNVYMDLSLALNLVSPIAGRLVEETLACAPASKLLFGSDGHSVPETYWNAALTWRRAVPGLGT